MMEELGTILIPLFGILLILDITAHCRLDKMEKEIRDIKQFNDYLKAVITRLDKR